MVVKIDLEKCDGCSDCLESCPSECMKVENEKCIVIEDECVDCDVCIEECPNEAITSGVE